VATRPGLRTNAAAQCGRFLREELGLTTGTAALLLRKTPWLLAMEVHILQQRQSAWQRGFGLSDAQLAKVIGRQPHLMTYTVTGIEEQAAAVLAWCRARGWTADDVVKMASTEPRLLMLDPANKSRSLRRHLRPQPGAGRCRLPQLADCADQEHGDAWQ